ncbi:hypothetical protein N7457_009328 [Penicillium paradoxum]|uniref:uncharacterized protein n=1 Tax=Penicillium paradoxum TaxID=176176 RepID=UPI002548CACD|nr:uncharacterized protein N7457_009328 [Penicillium paradoxum]KAJ5774432.1 hypothetical protein N7457_009328 [Penicillium paradoxum]
MQELKGQSCADLLILQWKQGTGRTPSWQQTRSVNFHLEDPNDLSSVLPAWSKACIIVADSVAIERCSQCRQSFTDAFRMPRFWWSYYFRKGNGGFGCESTRHAGLTTGFNTWSKFAVKMVEQDTRFRWYHTNIFTRWLPSTKQTVVLAFDLDPPVKERFLRAAMNPDETWLNDPFWVYPYLVEQIALTQEPAVWGIRDHVRGMETEAKPEGRPQPDYRRLHDIARHAIHVNETLDVALKNLEHILTHHEDFMNLKPENACVASEDIHSRLRSWESFISNLRFRSISNEKRLQNEIQLAFNTVAQHDAGVTLEIGRATQIDSATMKTIAFVTLTFLPPTFICAIFSMSFFDYGSDSGWTMSSKFWIYWVFAIPTTVFTTLVWTYWPDIRRMLFSKDE